MSYGFNPMFNKKAFGICSPHSISMMSPGFNKMASASKAGKFQGGGTFTQQNLSEVKFNPPESARVNLRVNDNESANSITAQTEPNTLSS